ncbi:hypothetical protein PG994_004636 [Apiospora phragmitis]|uniref:Uncharacterized protein n=1 Tax=Apiospora phragmitis TaxID=2905665 RepID=A0ABR1VRF3_9PEZI
MEAMFGPRIDTFRLQLDPAMEVESPILLDVMWRSTLLSFARELGKGVLFFWGVSMSDHNIAFVLVGEFGLLTVTRLLMMMVVMARERMDLADSVRCSLAYHHRSTWVLVAQNGTEHDNPLSQGAPRDVSQHSKYGGLPLTFLSGGQDLHVGGPHQSPGAWRQRKLHQEEPVRLRFYADFWEPLPNTFGKFQIQAIDDNSGDDPEAAGWKSHWVTLLRYGAPHDEPHGEPADIQSTTPTTSLFRQPIWQYGRPKIPRNLFWRTSFFPAGKADTHPFFSRKMGSYLNPRQGPWQMDTFLVHYPDRDNLPTTSEFEGTIRQISEIDGCRQVQWGAATHTSSSVMIMLIWHEPAPRKTRVAYDLFLKTGKCKSAELISWKIPQHGGISWGIPPSSRDAKLVELIRFRLPGEHRGKKDRELLRYLLERFRLTMQLTALEGTVMYKPITVEPTLLVQHYATLDSLTAAVQQQDVALLIDWRNQEDRKKWLTGFMSHPYNMMGHHAHILGCICPSEDDIKVWSANL